MKTGSVKVLNWRLRQRESPVIQYPSHSKCWHFVHWRFLAYRLIPETIIFLIFPGSPVVRTCAFTAKGRGSSPGQETKIPQAVLCGQKRWGKRKKKYVVFLLVEFLLLLFWLPLFILGSHPGPSPAPEVFLRNIWQDRELWQRWENLLCAWG